MLSGLAQRPTVSMLPAVVVVVVAAVALAAVAE
jgi:hypothetical protein